MFQPNPTQPNRAPTENVAPQSAACHHRSPQAHQDRGTVQTRRTTPYPCHRRGRREGHSLNAQYTRPGPCVSPVVLPGLWRCAPIIADKVPPWEDICIADAKPLPKNTGPAHANRRKVHTRTHELAVVQEPTDTVVHAYTDAACLDVTAGVKATAFWNAFANHSEARMEYDLQARPTEFELCAIAWAIDSTLQSCRNTHTLDIYTDSQAALHACKSHYYTYSTIQRIKQLRKTAASTARTKVILHWVPGHADIHGNKKAHEAVQAIVSNCHTSPSPALPAPFSADPSPDPCDPDKILRSLHAKRKPRLHNAVPPNLHPLPPDLARVGQAFLFRLCSRFALTPDVLGKSRTYRQRHPATADDDDGVDGDTDAYYIRVPTATLATPATPAKPARTATMPFGLWRNICTGTAGHTRGPVESTSVQRGP